MKQDNNFFCTIVLNKSLTLKLKIFVTFLSRVGLDSERAFTSNIFVLKSSKRGHIQKD